MKYFVVAFLLALFLFSGCLIQPQVTVKSVKDSGETILVELHSNKQLNASVKLKDQSGNVLCQENVALNQGNTSFGMQCILTDSVVVVEVVAEGAVFSDSVEIEFDGSNVEGKVLSLAEETIEGETLGVFSSNLALSNQCNAQLFVNNMKKYYAYVVSVNPDATNYYPELGLDNLTSEQMQELQDNIDTLKPCKIAVEKEINRLGNSKYSVSYSLISENCESTLGYGTPTTERDAVIIEVDVKNNLTEVTKGSMASSYNNEEQLRQQIQAYKFLGPCMKYMLLGAYVSVIEEPYQLPEEKACNYLSGDIKIDSFAVEKGYVILHLTNISKEDIQFTGFTGSPVELSCDVCPLTLEPLDFTILNLHGDFSEYEEINEELIISYTLNDLEHSQIADCQGIVGNFMEEIEKIKTDTELIVITEDELNKIPTDNNISIDVNVLDENLNFP
ncbi:hypothetical protein KKG83_04190 [Candidatus Micrarchaeota archaeon]|nr:hypothetical protein [Candidatus Micrarchaeota archaeon]MBU2476644.1 hypothetical protein [Candidatus Micrarchaeota archaeon]